MDSPNQFFRHLYLTINEEFNLLDVQTPEIYPLGPTLKENFLHKDIEDWAQFLNSEELIKFKTFLSKVYTITSSCHISYTDEYSSEIFFNVSALKSKDLIILELTDLTPMLMPILDQSNFYKNTVWVLCHDINNHLAVSLNSLKLLNKILSSNDEKVLKYLEKTHHATTNIKELIEFVREFEAAKSGKKSLTLVGMTLDELKKDLLFTFEEKFMAKNLNFKFIDNLPKDAKFLVEPISFKNSVMNNLISNALKFSNKGDTITIEAGLNDQGIQISVKDSGIGMPLLLQKNVFRNDKNTSRSGTDGEKGTGLGMPLVKSYVELYGGEISVESKDIKDFPTDHGTTFKILLNKE